MQLDCAQADHHGKRFSKLSVHGDKLLNWRYTVFNSVGQAGIAINVESCSFYDTLLVEAHAAWRVNAARRGHCRVELVTCDAPIRDGGGLLSAIYAGDGKTVAAFSGTLVLVSTEAECDAACAKLRSLGTFGLDTENVAYIPPHVGVSREAAALAQACGSDDECFLFLLHR